MKQITITTGKATIVVVDFPTDVVKVKCDNYFVNVKFEGDIDYTPFINSGSKLKYLGHPSELTEEDWKGIVDDYVNQGKPIYMAFVTDTDAYATAKEAGLSLIKANGVVMENTTGERPENCPCRKGQTMCFIECGLSLQYANWQQAQEQVWLNPQIFVKL